MKIVVLDGYTLNPGDLSWEGLDVFGDVHIYDRTSYDLKGKDLIIDRSRDADIIFTNKTPLTREILDVLPNLKYIGVLATGYDVVDIETAIEKGITVTNIPTYGTAAVAQMTFALLLEMCHHVGAHSEAVFNGDWGNNLDWCFWNYPLIELSGKTMGIIGYGRIGQNVGKIAQEFGLNVLASDSFYNPSLENDFMRYAELDELIANSDIISLHCPLSNSTKGIINKDTIAKMKNNVMLINTSRGQLIVDEDLANALNDGKIAGAALDVVSHEPIKQNNPLLKAKNCIITPHISWAPKESRARLMNVAIDNLISFLKGNPVNVVNK
ncbi:D-2-hydroxyacid dehydrogenase [Tissierella sp. Yu-01]|uniref:D-2-hydroxyacid dehydrogenase n=1 Tax=Tissierella sp. Yu-01 TaxID=3035694 RepID=UPI00240DE466|nr:D-2-hydroxyacid dehydrogenase [Tissierella sp. Yu-01]WFA08066.1 D-2-hydroxyacid dehydrogenase [Tissierella sp. Yu-01]